MLDVFSNPGLQPVRLVSGLILFAFAASHFLNHAAGLVGLDAANAVQDWRLIATHSLLGRIVLPGAAITHILLGLGKFASRRTFRMPVWEALQIATGIIIPILLIPHVVAITYFGSAGFYYSYTSVAYLLWPGQALWQSALLLVVWVHGSIGLNYWLRTKAWYTSVKPWLLGVVVAVPVLALTGFLASAREAHALLTDADALARAATELRWPDSAAVAAMLRVRWSSWAIYAGLLTFAAALVMAQRIAARSAPMVAVTYTDGPTIRVAIGTTLLEVSRRNAIAHGSICGGRARCSTCRVRIDEGRDELSAPEPAERATLKRIGAPPNVRLACQLRPHKPVRITRLVTPSTTSQSRRGTDSHADAGVEKQVAILFLDVRGFTRLSQDRLPFDVVFLLNQFFAIVGEMINSQQGWIDKYMGDGLMAIFGREEGIAAGCRQAIIAARAIDIALDGLNNRLSAEVPGGLRIGMGIHAGPVVVGRIGATEAAALTVIGNTVNEASRLESLTKERNCQLIISQLVLRLAELPLTVGLCETVDVRGSDTQLDVVLIRAARDFPDSFEPLNTKRLHPVISAAEEQTKA